MEIMFTKGERFSVKKTPESSDKERRQQVAQTTERASRLDRRNRIKELSERWERHYRRHSWVKPFLRACKYVQSLPIDVRRELFKSYLPFTVLPQELSGEEPGRVLSSPFYRWDRTEKIEKEENTPSVKLNTRTVDEVNWRYLEEGVESEFTLNSTAKNLFGEGS